MRIMLDKLLEDRKVSQRQLSKATKIRPSTISDLCNNNVKYIKAEYIEKICKNIGCQVGELIEI